MPGAPQKGGSATTAANKQPNQHFASIQVAGGALEDFQSSDDGGVWGVDGKRLGQIAVWGMHGRQASRPLSVPEMWTLTCKIHERCRLLNLSGALCNVRDLFFSMLFL